MELHLKPVSKVCRATGETFTPGESVSSFLFRNEEGELERADVKTQAAENFEVSGPLLCRWTHIARERQSEEAATRKQVLQTSEEMFLSLFEDEEILDDEEEMPDTVQADREALKHLLALMLERKRVLRPVSGKPGVYWHVKRKETYEAPAVDLTPDQLLQIQTQLSELV